MVIITFKNGETQVFNEDSQKLITLWKDVESINSVVYGVYMDETSEDPNQITTAPAEAPGVTPAEAVTIGAYIREHRLAKGFKQRNLIWALDNSSDCKRHRKQDASYAINFISRIENNRVIPSLTEFQTILDDLGIDSLDATIIGRWYDSEGKYKY